MSLDPTVLADLSGVTKDVYSEFFEDVFPYMTPFMAQIKRMNPKRLQYGANAVFFSIRTGRRGGFVTSGGTLPNGGNAPTAKGSLGITRSYIKQELDGLALAATEGTEAAFVSLAKKSLDETYYEIQLNLNRICHGDSKGVRATVTATNTATSFTVGNAYGITGAGHGAMHLAIGDNIVLRDTTGATLRAGRGVITGITPSSNGTAVLTLAGSGITGVTVTDVVCTATDTEDSYGREANGLESIIDSTGALATFEGITVASNPYWKAQNIAATGGQIDEMEVIRLLTTIKAKGGVDPLMNPDEYILMCSSGILLQFAEPLLGQRRFERSYDLKGGYKAVECAGLALLDDPDMPRGKLAAVHVPSLAWVDLRDFGKLKYGDSTAWIQSPGQDGFECTLRSYWNLGTIARNAHGSLTGITDTADYSRVAY